VSDKGEYIVKSQVKGGIGGRLDLEAYHKVCAELLNWRIDNFIRDIEDKGGGILAFVRGLHFSTQLIYAIRDVISETGLEVDWGHLLDKNGIYCSRECDIIIHRKGHHGRWNGNEKPVMDFKFVKQDSVLVVISCKSYLKSGGVDKNYVRFLKPFVKKIWLFAECCESKDTDSIVKQAQNAGYESFCYMYKWERKTESQEPNESGWREFVKKLRKLKR
jgi:hypothetical protein